MIEKRNFLYVYIMKYIQAKSILSKLRSKDPYFGLTYNMNIYRGCQHGCIYCDTRSECYGVGDISQVAVKKNAIDLLRKELSSRTRIKGTIGTGSMNDPYMPIEKELQLERQALGVIADAKYPVHIITKSDMVTRDYDLLQEISKTYAAVSFTITTTDDYLARRIEPGAPPPSDRFRAMGFLAAKGVYVGVTLMPLLPFINDTPVNIIDIIQHAKWAGASYVIPMFGVTLRKGSRDYLYKTFDEGFEGMRQKYESAFEDRYYCNSPKWKLLEETYQREIENAQLSSKMEFFGPVVNEQLSFL